MTKDNKQTEPLDSTKPAIAYTHCCVSGAVLNNKTMKIKAIYIKNLKLSEGKVASQVAHAVKNLGTTPTDCDIIVLGVSTTKFNELTAQHECYIQRDKGLTEVENGTATAAAWIDVP